MKYLPMIVAATALVGCESSEKNPYAGTYNLSGTVTGLTGDLWVSINGSREIISSNGEFSSETRITNGDSFEINLIESTDNINCVIENNTGTSETNVTDIQITCDGTEQVAYHLNGFAFNVEEPSVISFAFHLIDRETDLALTNLNTENIEEYLRLTENGEDISPSESFLEVDPVEDFNVEYHTAFAIDVSASLNKDELAQIVTTIKNSVYDSNTATSKINPNQLISIYTFDENVVEVVSKSQDIETIFNQLEQIEIGEPSTNLYGAIEMAANNWDNEISLEKVSYGNLILFTDGKDSSAKVSKEDALEASEGKDIYFIAVGDETDSYVLEEFTSPNNIFTLTEYAQLEEAVSNAFNRMKTYEEGLYILSYATPKRSGEHTLTIEAQDDYRCDFAINEYEQKLLDTNGELSKCVDEVSYTFSANNFSSVQPELSLVGPRRTLLEEVQWKANLRWSRETPMFSWTIESCSGDNSFEISDDNLSATFTRNEDAIGILKVTLTDDVTSTSVTEYALLANSLRAYIKSEKELIQACSYL